MLVIVVRPDRESRGWQLVDGLQTEYPHRTKLVNLVPLSDQQSGILIESLLANQQFPEATTNMILEKTGGNPLFLEEVVRSLVEKKVVSQKEDGSWQISDDATDYDLPDSLETLIISRIDRLEEETRRILQVASVIGRNFNFRVLVALFEKGDDLEQHIDLLQRVDMIQESARIPELEYSFRHSLAQEAAYNTLLVKRRKEYHLRVAEVIEKLFSDRLAEYFSLLAHHHFQAGSDQSIRFDKLAGDKAFLIYAIPEALFHYRRAIQAAGLPESIGEQVYLTKDQVIDLFLRAGRCLELLSDYHAAQVHYSAMESAARKIDDKECILASLTALGTAYAVPSNAQDKQRCLTVCEEGLALSRQVNDRRAEARILWNLGLIHLFADNTDHAIQYLEQSVEIARSIDWKEQLTASLGDLARAFSSSGRFQDGLNILREVNPIVQEIGDLTNFNENLMNMSSCLIATGDFDQALELAVQGLEGSRRINNEWGIIYGSIFYLLVTQAQGKIDAFMKQCEEAVRKGEKIKHPGLIFILMNRGMLFTNIGALQSAMEDANHMVEVANTYLPLMSASDLVRAYYYLHTGDLEAANYWMDQCKKNHGIRSLFFFDYVVEQVEMELCIRTGRLEEARQKIDHWIPFLRENKGFYYLPDTLRIAGLYAQEMDDVKSARSYLEEAYTQSIQTGHRFQQLEILRTLFQLPGTTEDERVTWREEYRILADTISAYTSDPLLKETLLAEFSVEKAILRH